MSIQPSQADAKHQHGAFLAAIHPYAAIKVQIASTCYQRIEFRHGPNGLNLEQVRYVYSPEVQKMLDDADEAIRDIAAQFGLGDSITPGYKEPNL